MDFTAIQLIVVLFWIRLELLFTVSGRDVGTIRCNKKFYEYSCERESCTGTCASDCIYGKTIWGTAFYTYDSPICRSAIHDLRISTWNNSVRTVTFRYAYDIKEYLGSIRQGISTDNWGKLQNGNDGCFYFQSPRVTEELLDVVSLHRNYLHDGTSHIQECHLSTNAVNRQLFYSHYSQNENIQPIPCQNRGRYDCWRMQWNESKADIAGGYWCRPKDSMLSGVLSVAMSKNAEFIPYFFTLTTSIKDTATIEMNRAGTTNYVYWYKDGNKEDTKRLNVPRNGKVKLSFNQVKIGHAGIYNFYYYRNSQDSGKIRLIVRVCENGKYGPLCEYSCPPCQNGGICHDLTGDCLCPPGFNGTYCENACEIGFFGKNCNQRCHDEFGNPATCKEIQFCLPDPYGCSCGSGYETIFCNQPCSFGYYGAGCTQLCSEKCKRKYECDYTTGSCLSGCKNGWYGNRCVTSYPLFVTPPVVLKTTENSITIKFSEWNAISQSGEGVPASYQIQYMDSNNDKWIDGDNLLSGETKSHLEYFSTIKDLLPDTMYYIRVVVIDSSGEKQLNNISIAIARTDCGDPQEPPSDIKVNSSQPDRIHVGWKLPPKENWRCSKLSTELFYNNSRQSLRHISENEEFEFETKPYTAWYISLRSRGKGEHYSSWSSPVIVTSAEDAPSEVRTLTVQSLSFQKILVTWEIPAKENGVVRYYSIKYKQLRWLHKCNLNVSSSYNQKNTTDLSSYINVRPSAEYELVVSAVTVKEGPSVKTSIMTEETVPGGPPKDLHLSSVGKKELELKWEPPQCELYHGRITGYNIILYSQEPWDTNQHNESTTRHELKIKNLKPFTNYHAFVFAKTKAGLSNFSAQLSNRTLSDSPPAPYNITVYHKTGSILSVSWKPPYPPNGKLEKYSVHYSCNSGCLYAKTLYVPVEEAVCDAFIRKDFHCVVISGLVAVEKYTIKVNAYNEGVPKAGEGISVEGETKEALPDPPQKGEVRNTTESSLDIIWDVPHNTNGNITSYRVNITAINSYNESIVGMNFSKIVSHHSRSHMFQNLYPATMYKITIEASTSAGYGNPFIFETTTQNSVPVIDTEPVLGEITSTTVVLLIRPIKFKGGPISEYYVIVQHAIKRKKRMIPEFFPVSYNASEQSKSDYYAAAKFLPTEINTTGINFTVGDGKIYNEFYNPPLEPGKRYNLGMAVLSNYSGDVQIGIKFLSQEIITADPVKIEGSNLTGIVIGILVALLLLAIVVIIVIAFRYPHLYENMRKRANLNSKSMLKGEELISMSTDVVLDDLETEQFPEPEPCRIAVSCLEDYIQKNLPNGKIRKQYVLLGKGQCHPSEYAKKPENKLKNRYGNFLSYDHSRVVLEKLPNDPHSDYINANYVDGYKKPKRYIATQGPKPVTVADFWRMIWQENVIKVIMSTNLIESGKTKCEKYWPDTSNLYGEIDVSLINTEMYADYVIRTFHIKKGSVIREIKHFHFTTWPDHGVPMYAVAVGNFVQKVRSYRHNDEASILVHCSAGIGRTGTIIMIDSMMDMAAAEGHVDLITHLYKMRQQRINIIETLDQYCFAYQVLVEVLCRENTAILCSEYFDTLIKFKEVNPSTQKTTFHVQFEKLTKLSPVLKASDCKIGSEVNNLPKNRSRDIVPPDCACILTPALEDSCELTYLNAVYVNGYRKKHAFIVTQIPLPETVQDFWRMAYYAKASTIVLLNGLEPTDETCLPYWPESNEIYGGILVHNIGVEHHGEIQIRTFELRNATLKEEQQIPKIIKQFHLTNWMPCDYLPSSSEIILNLIEKVERWQKQSGSAAIVQCLNGVRASGLFCASVFICDKIKAEQEVDVFLAVRSIRTSRPQFIENVEQYIYCHQMALTFLDTFELYANFQ